VFPEAFKLEAVSAIRGGQSVSQAAAALGLQDWLVRTWLNWAEQRGTAASGGPAPRRKRRFRRTTDSAHAYPVAPNRLRRQFTAAAPDRVWLADLTYIGTAEGWLYLAVVLDLVSRRVVGEIAAELGDVTTETPGITLGKRLIASSHWFVPAHART
jgi:transposase-like protein